MEQIQDILDRGNLPESFATELSCLLDGNGRFVSQEGVNWDFKREWPFSYSDSNFGGIARLICAFANSRGGLIIFGVHDKTRTGGHNKVPPNLDKLQKALNQLLTSQVYLSVHRYTVLAGDVDVLLVSPRSSNEMPVRFARQLDQYAAGVIWVRDGHEVTAAEPRHIAMLYCRAQVVGTDSDDLSLAKGLPPTLRNVPAQSLANSIEVPGLSAGGEYEEFVKVCAEQFRAGPPPASFVSGRLTAVSERRPLVIESIIALSRNAGSYDRALQLFEQHSGDDVRRYVFQREWDSLSADNYARHVLAIIALNGESITFEDLIALTRYDEGRVKDAISEIREMFLTINNAGAETSYSLAALTAAFVLDEARKLDTFPTLRARVEQYKRNVFPENPLLTRIRDRVEGLIEKGARFSDHELTAQAWSAVLDPIISPKIIEDPRFIALQGYVAARQSPPKCADARRFFANALSMKFEPEFEYLKAWFYAEKHSGYGVDQCVKIADIVAAGKRYSDKEKLYILSRKASILFNRAKEDRFNTPEKAISEIVEALRIHIYCFEKHRQVGDYETDKSEEFARNTAFFLFDFLVKSSGFDDLFGTVSLLLRPKEPPPDVITQPLVFGFSLLAQASVTIADSQKIRNKLSDVKREIDGCSNWRDHVARELVVSAVMAAASTIAQRYRRN